MRFPPSIVLLAATVTLAFADGPAPSAAPAPPLPIQEFPPNEPARGVIVLGSGDGGWSDIEDRVCTGLAARGWYVAGIDFSKYADAPYDQQKLARDFAAVARYAQERSGNDNLPVVYSGWSMGAEQSVAAAALASERPPGLHGLLLLCPGKRGRYGLRVSDKLGIPPTGAGTFALGEFRNQLGTLKVAQIHGQFDPLDNTSWLEGLTAPHKEWVVPHGWHDLANASSAALQIIGKAADWVCTSQGAS